MAVSY